MTNDELFEMLYEHFDYDIDIASKVVMFENPSYTDAVIGISDDYRLIYSYDKMVEWLMKNDNMSETDAIDFIERNTISALSYPSSMGLPDKPIVMHNIVGL